MLSIFRWSLGKVTDTNPITPIILALTVADAAVTIVFYPALMASIRLIARLMHLGWILRNKTFIRVTTWLYSITKPTHRPFFIALALTFLATVLVAILTVLLVWFSVLALLKCILLLLGLFTNSWEDVFNAELLVGRVPIVEMKTKDGFLYRGIFRDYHAIDEKAISTITASNILAMKRKKIHRTFARGNRDVMVFSNHSSKLSVPFGSITDFNQWYLTYNQKHWLVEIDSEESMIGQIWYLDLLMSKFRVHFKLSDFQVKAKGEYGFIFLEELLALIEKYYFSNIFLKFTYGDKNRQTYFQFKHEALVYLKVYRKNRNTIEPNIRAKMDQSRARLIKGIRRFYRKVRKPDSFWQWVFEQGSP